MNFLLTYRVFRKKGKLDKPVKITQVLDETHAKRVFKEHMKTKNKPYKILEIKEISYVSNNI